MTTVHVDHLNVDIFDGDEVNIYYGALPLHYPKITLKSCLGRCDGTKMWICYHYQTNRAHCINVNLTKIEILSKAPRINKIMEIL